MECLGSERKTWGNLGKCPVEHVVQVSAQTGIKTGIRNPILINLNRPVGTKVRWLL